MIGALIDAPHAALAAPAIVAPEGDLGPIEGAPVLHVHDCKAGSKQHRGHIFQPKGAHATSMLVNWAGAEPTRHTHTRSKLHISHSLSTDKARALQTIPCTQQAVLNPPSVHLETRVLSSNGTHTLTCSTWSPDGSCKGNRPRSKIPGKTGGGCQR